MERISATQLESFVNCPHSFFKSLNDREPIAKESILNTGTIFHTAMQSPIIAQKMLENDKTMDVGERKVCKELINTAYRIEKKYDIYEQRLEYKYKDILFTGHIDAILADPTKPYVLITDFKTSKKRWKEEEIKTKMQRLFYSYLFFKTTGISNIAFEYLIVQKKKNISKDDITIFREVIDVPVAERITEKYLDTYLEFKKKNKDIKQYGDHCFWCKYRQECKEEKEKNKEKNIQIFDIEI